VAIDKIQSESINLADNFAFTGTVSGAGGVNTPAFSAYQGATQNISNNSSTKVPINSRNFDTDNNYDHSTNYRFTPTTSGKYYVYGKY
jgi:hypothetical protein